MLLCGKCILRMSLSGYFFFVFIHHCLVMNMKKKKSSRPNIFLEESFFLGIQYGLPLWMFFQLPWKMFLGQNNFNQNKLHPGFKAVYLLFNLIARAEKIGKLMAKDKSVERLYSFSLLKYTPVVCFPQRDVHPLSDSQLRDFAHKNTSKEGALGGRRCCTRKSTMTVLIVMDWFIFQVSFKEGEKRRRLLKMPGCWKMSWCLGCSGSRKNRQGRPKISSPVHLLLKVRILFSCLGVNRFHTS